MSAGAAAMSDHPVTRYLIALAALCFEVAAHPELLGTFLRILALVPQTIAALAAEKRRIVA